MRKIRGVPIRLLILLGILSLLSMFLRQDWLPIALLALPLVGSVVGMILPPTARGKTWGQAVSATSMFTAISMAFQFDWSRPGYQFVVSGPTISGLDISFSLG